MRLNMVYGSGGAGKTHYLCSKMIEDITKGDKQYIYIVPEQFTLETQKKMVNMRYDMHGLSGIMDVDIVSFNRLAFRIFEELGVDRLSVVDDMGKVLILRKVIEENKDKLVIYKDKANMTGFIEEIKSVISELYQFGINVDDIDEIVGKLKGQELTKAKLKEIAFIYDAFRKYIAEMTDDKSSYITKEEVLKELIRLVPESEIIRNSHIVLDGYTGFTPIQLKLIAVLMECCKGMTVSVTIRPEELNLTSVGCIDVKEQELFKMSKDTINSLYAIANDKRIPILEPIIIGDDYKKNHTAKDLMHIDRLVFEYEENKSEIIPENIKIYKASAPAKEAKYIADKICKLIKDNPTLRYRDIAVITADASAMTVVDRYFNNANIPHFVDNKKNILGNPFVESIRAVLDIIQKDFRYESVFRYLRTYLADIDMDDIDKLDNYCLAMGIKGRKKYANEFLRVPYGMTNEELCEINNIKEKVVAPILELYEDIKGQDVKGITTGLIRFISKLEYQRKATEYAKRMESEGNMEKRSEYSQVMDRILELLAKLIAMLGEEKMKLSEYISILDAGFCEIKVGVVPMSVDRVIVGDIERTRLSKIKVLFIMGANDGNIPKHSNKGGLLSQNDRIALKDVDVLLSKTARESAFDQKFYMYLFLTKPTEKLYVTYSETGSDGSLMRPSYLIDSITDMFVDSTKILCDEENSIYENANSETVFEYLLTKLKEYGSDTFDNALKEMLTYYGHNDKYAERLIKGINGAFFVNHISSIEAAAAKAVYGENIIGATRLEKYAECAYAHFMQYGLKVAERKIYEIQAADIGTIYHKCIELFTKTMKEKGMSPFDVDDDTRRELIHECMEVVSAKYNTDIFNDSRRNNFILSKCEKVADKTAWAIIEHLKKGNFTPEMFELSVNTGKVDRVDILEDDGTRFVKIIDYKSGDTKFSPMDAINGLKIQLMFYMDSLLKRERKMHKDVRVEPGAVFYFNIQDPLLDFDVKLYNSEEYDKQMLKKFAMTGVVNSREEVFNGLDKEAMESGKSSIVFGMSKKELDSSISIGSKSCALANNYFEKFIDLVMETADQHKREILEGNIELNPYMKGKKTPCKYCPYKDICSFDSKEFCNNYRKLPDNDKEAVCERIMNTDANVQEGI